MVAVPAAAPFEKKSTFATEPSLSLAVAVNTTLAGAVNVVPELARLTEGGVFAVVQSDRRTGR